MAAKKVKSSKAGAVANAAKSKAKSVQTQAAASVKKPVPAKKSASAKAKTSKPAASKAKVSAAKPPSKAKQAPVKAKAPAVKTAKAPSKAKTPAAKTPSKAKQAPVKAKAPAAKTPSPAKKSPSKASAAGKGAAKTAASRPSPSSTGKSPAKVDSVLAGDVHETASTISTGGRATRSFSTIMQGHAAIAKGIEARKAAAKAKNLARFPHTATLRIKTTRKLTEKQSKAYEQMLLRLRDELSRQIAYLRGASLTRSDEVNPEEDGSDAFERQLALKLASNEGDAIFEIDEALQRIKDGTYAICEDCGCIINSPRLKALPFVRRCVECKRIAEKKRTADDRRYF